MDQPDPQEHPGFSSDDDEVDATTDHPFFRTCEGAVVRPGGRFRPTSYAPRFTHSDRWGYVYRRKLTADMFGGTYFQDYMCWQYGDAVVVESSHVYRLYDDAERND